MAYFNLPNYFNQAEKRKCEMKARVEQLKKEKQDFSGAENLVNEVYFQLIFYFAIYMHDFNGTN